LESPIFHKITRLTKRLKKIEKDISLSDFQKHSLIRKNKKKIQENELLLGLEKDKITNKFSAIFVRRNSRIAP